MKTIGLIGGLSWESTSEYYRIINEGVKEALGGLHSAKCLVYSFNFEEIVQLQKAEAWELATKEMVHAAITLECAGADFILICTNTMHKMADEVQKSISVPLLHIVDATAVETKKMGIKTVALLGTKYTMEQSFFKNRFLENHNINIITPNEEDREIIHNVIFNELCQGEILQESRNKYLDIIRRLEEQGAQGIILGCTEIPLLLKQEDVNLPLFDTTSIHAKVAVKMALVDHSVIMD